MAFLAKYAFILDELKFLGEKNYAKYVSVHVGVHLFMCISVYIHMCLYIFMLVNSIDHSNRRKRNMILFHIRHRFQGPERKETLKISADSRTEHLTACQIAGV